MGQMLKAALMSSGYGHVKTVAGDAMSWQIVDDYINSTALQQSLDVIGYEGPHIGTVIVVLGFT